MARVVMGIDEQRAPNQFIINPRLQRTRNGDPTLRQGLTLGTLIPNFKVIQKGIVRLENRAVPLNSKQGPSKRVPRKDLPSLRGVPRGRGGGSNP